MEKNNKKMNKKAMSISIVVLVLATLTLTIFSLFVFNIRGNNLSEKVNVANLDRVYAIEELINFYVDLMIEHSIEANMDENKFTDNFKKEFENYKQGDNFVLEELRQIEEQIKDENIEIEKVNGVNKKVRVNLNIDIEDSLIYDKEEIIFISYSYTKTFEKDL